MAVPAPAVTVKLNITDEQGVLLGQIDLSDDDLRHPRSIGERVVEQLPVSLRPSLGDLTGGRRQDPGPRRRREAAGA